MFWYTLVTSTSVTACAVKDGGCHNIHIRSGNCGNVVAQLRAVSATDAVRIIRGPNLQVFEDTHCWDK
jgi:hypothetical protein